MASPTTDLRVRISAELGDIRSGLAALRRDLQTVRTQAAQALPDGNAFAKGLRTAHAELRAFAATYLSIAGAKMLATVADEASILRSRIKEAKGDYQALLAVAQSTRTSFGATVDLFTRMERATRAQGINQQRLLGITQSVNQAIKLSYQGTAQAEAAVLQLGQALASGKLGGDELSSLAENAPRLTQAIADGLGVPIAKLKEMGKEGELTTRKVVKALETQAKVLQEEYGRVPLTIGDAMTQVRNAFTDFIGKQDEATGASRRFAAALSEFATRLPEYLTPLLTALSLLLEHLDTVAVFMVSRLALAAIPAVITAVTALQAALVAGAGAAATLRGALMLLGGPVGIAIAALAAGIYYLATQTDRAKEAAEAHNKALQANRELADLSADAARRDAIEKRKQAIETLNAARATLAQLSAQAAMSKAQAGTGSNEGAWALQYAAAANERRAKEAAEAVAQAEKQLDDWTDRLVRMSLEASRAVTSGAAAAKGATGSATEDADKAKKAVRGVVDQSAVLQDTIKRDLEDLDRRFAAGAVRIADYFAKKRELQLQAVDAQIAQAQAEAKTAKTSEQQSKALTEIVRLQHERAAIAPAAAREQQAAEKDLEGQLDKVRAKIAELNGDTAQATRKELEAEFRELLKRLETEGRAAEAAMVRGFIDHTVVEKQVADFEAKAQRILGELRTAETSFASQADAGLLGNSEAERQIQQQRSKSLEQLRQLREAALAYLHTLSADSPEAQSVLQYLQSLNGDIAEVASTQREFAQGVEDTLAGSMRSFFKDLRSDTKSAKEAWEDFVKSFVEGVAEMIAQKMALKAADAIVGAAGFQFHSGGVVGGGGTRRALNPMWFGNAPRYHSGGIAGLRPNEVPAVLEAGEEVLTRDNPRHIANARGAGNVQVVVNNNSGAPATVSESTQGGTRRIDVMIGEIAVNAVAADLANGGKVARTGQRAMGWRPQGPRRG